MNKIKHFSVGFPYLELGEAVVFGERAVAFEEWAVAKTFHS